jgi:hypothetical protein
MTRPRFRRSLRFENLETRQLMSAGGPTAQEQYMLELINQARTNPQAAAERVTSNLTPDVVATLNYYGTDVNAAKQAIATASPKPPLAWNADLAAAAQGHSQDMANTQVQSHTGSDGSSPQQRIQQAGYTGANSTGENAYAYSTSVDEAMQAFLLDWGVADQGHRRNLLQPNVNSDNAYKDVGIGIVNTSNSKFGPMVITQDFGSTPNSLAQLVGVAYNDNQNTQFYAPGEGQGNVLIDATNLATGATTSTTTWDSGGYQIALAPGQYQVIASVNGTVVQTTTLTIGTQNVEQDFILSNTWDGRSRDQVLNSIVPTNSQTNSSANSSANTSWSALAPVSAPSQPSAPTQNSAPVTVAVPSQGITASAPLTVNYNPSAGSAWTSWKAQMS